MLKITINGSFSRKSDQKHQHKNEKYGKTAKKMRNKKTKKILKQLNETLQRCPNLLKTALRPNIIQPVKSI
jgi:hypothetical protein